MEVNQIIGTKYEVIEIIKQSDQGSVGKCVNRYLHSPWLIKYLKGHNHSEMKHLMALNLMNVPKVVDSYKDRIGTYYIMTLLDGITLNEYAKTHRLKLNDVLHLMRQLMSILEHLHAQNIVHGDIKPENLMILPGGYLALVDFGSSFTMQDSGAFTPEYVAPERLLDTYPVDERSDLYSAGLVFSKLMKRHWPKSSALARVLRKSMKTNPDHRYESAGQISDLLAKM